jgi:hypothetical protein
MEEGGSCLLFLFCSVVVHLQAVACDDFLHWRRRRSSLCSSAVVAVLTRRGAWDVMMTMMKDFLARENGSY